MNKSLKCFGAKVLNRMGIVRKYDTRRNSIRILMYHRVNTISDCLGLTVSPELFSQQLKFLTDNYEVISLAEAVSRLTAGPLSGNCCVLTFDDGYRDNYQIAAPLLKKHNVPATIFVTYDAIENGQFGWGAFDRALLTTKAVQIDLSQWGLGKYNLSGQTVRELAVVTLHRQLKKLPDAEKQVIVTHVVETYGDNVAAERTMMTWSEVQELANGGLVSIGSHTISHPILSRIPAEKARYEIIDGKRLLEEKIGLSVDFFAYPNGGHEDINSNVVAFVKKGGYKAACTTVFGHNILGNDNYKLYRIDVTAGMSTDSSKAFSPDLFALSLSGLLHRNWIFPHNLP